MRMFGLGVLVAFSACGAPSTPPVTPGTKPVEAAIVGRYPLSVPGGTVGTITSIVRCGATLYLADVGSRIHRLNLTSGRVESPIDDGSILPMALAADCDRGRVWAISPQPRARGLRAVAFDITSGSAIREFTINVPCFPTSATVSRDVLFVGGECIEGAVPDRDTRMPASSYYANKRIGVRVSLNSGEVQGGLVPFETSCDAAGACVGGSISALGDGWVASLPVSSQIGVYSRDGELTRTIPVGSAGATARDGSLLAASASSEERVNWSSRNSLIHHVVMVGNQLAVVHYLLDVPPGWKMGAQRRPQFRARVNVLTTDGTPLHVDVPLPEVPVGSDSESLYLVDYGSSGRQDAHEAVTVLRLALPSRDSNSRSQQ